MAEKISSILNVDIDEIIDLKERTGIVGWFVSGKDALFNKLIEIKYSKDPSNYDLINY